MKYFIILFVTGILVSSCSKAQPANSTSSNNNSAYVVSNEGNLISWVANQRLPENLSFCGERVPLEIPEVRERAEREFYLLLQQPAQLVLYLKRAGRYFDIYDRVIREEGAPSDLKYLSVAESALFMARSSKDAVGLWQFIPATGRAFGLRIDDDVDERRHPEKSTRAGVKYLKQGYNTFKSWTLAAAGYNMGHENVSENLRYQQANSFYDLYLNEETSRYVFRIALIKEFMENGARYGLNIPQGELYKPETYTVVSVDDAIPDLAAWARGQGTTYKDVKLFNLWILKRALPAPERGKPYQIYIPKKS
ncbi:MAG TPA: transglycosylase SLT domain-containing protein [Patescibacteria group bacterium]|nr:transglycosylase SLT domain-containing protein [Patescibacteria group bacterium]